jgi:hypothetical protein
MPQQLVMVVAYVQRLAELAGSLAEMPAYGRQKAEMNYATTRTL